MQPHTCSACACANLTSSSNISCTSTYAACFSQLANCPHMWTVAGSLRVPSNASAVLQWFRWLIQDRCDSNNPNSKLGIGAFPVFQLKPFKGDCSFWQHAHNPHNEGPCRKCSVVSAGAHLVTISRRAFGKPTNQPSFSQFLEPKGRFRSVPLFWKPNANEKVFR